MVNHASSNRPLTELTSKKIRKLRRPPQPALSCFESASTVADNSALLFCYSNVWKFLPWFLVNVIISWKPDWDRPSLGLQFIWTTQVQHAICKYVWFHFPVSSNLLTPHSPEVSLQLARNKWNFFFQMMSQSNFLSSLQSFPKDTINDEMVELLAPYLEMDDYNMETAKRVRWGILFMPVYRFMETPFSRNN